MSNTINRNVFVDRGTTKDMSEADSDAAAEDLARRANAKIKTEEEFEAIRKRIAAMTEEEADEAATNDQKWFAAHPGVNSRIRFVFPAEALLLSIEPVPKDGYILVHQVTPGMRLRFPLTFPDAMHVFEPAYADKIWREQRSRLDPKLLAQIERIKAEYDAIPGEPIP